MFDYNQLAHAFGKPLSTGQLKQSPDDFRVDEIPGFELSGEGEHLFLHIEKKGLNTEELVKALARATNRKAKDISYAGIKDRQALARQWLIIHLPGEDIPGADSLAGEGWHVISSKRHLKKLKIGALAGNHFQLTIRDISEMDDVEMRLQQVKQMGVPNYFGEQRFGYQGQNLDKAKAFLIDGVKLNNRFLKGMYYSAARSLLFNLILSARILNHTWNKAIPGDVMQLEGKNSVFAIELPDELIANRLASFDISPAAPLWGTGKDLATSEAQALMERVLSGQQDWCQALEKHRLERAWRSLVLRVSNLSWVWRDKKTLILQFNLPAGSYATSVVRELMDV